MQWWDGVVYSWSTRSGKSSPEKRNGSSVFIQAGVISYQEVIVCRHWVHKLSSEVAQDSGGTGLRLNPCQILLRVLYGRVL